MKQRSLFSILLFLLEITKVVWAQQAIKTERIVSLNGTVTEILCELGLQSQIVGTDATSTFPPLMKEKPKVGHNRNIGAEAVLALNPTVVVGVRTKIGGSVDVKPDVIQQLRSAGIKTVIFDQEYSVDGAKKMIDDVARSFGLPAKAAAIIRKLDADLSKACRPANPPNVLFIYARGAGSLMVAGRHTPIEKLIELSGGKNAFIDFDYYKTLTPEALVTANPDVILLFTSGLKSLGGLNGLLKVPGVVQTHAGRNRRVIEMDGQLLTGFSPRLGLAVQTLSRKFVEEQPLKNQN